jgi:hypothetical protein
MENIRRASLNITGGIHLKGANHAWNYLGHLFDTGTLGGFAAVVA